MLHAGVGHGRKSQMKKLLLPPESDGTSPKSSKLLDEQRWDLHQHDYTQAFPPKEAPRVLQEYLRLSDEPMSQLQQPEEKVKNLSEKLANALADITTKDNLVKQHTKVAEDAVTGWEKAEAEAVGLKLQLDAALQQKLATEDRVAHLDGALKECMKQLRHVREEQEQQIHDTLVKKTREYDNLRAEMESKLAEASQLVTQTRSELLESRAEGMALTQALQERSHTIAQLSEAKGRTEADNKVLQVRLELMEKENANLTYEVHVLTKELEIRNSEREYERKATDAAAKQHLESVKKIAKLEEECNRLRILVRKKLPGPAAIARMKVEVDSLGKDRGDTKQRRRSFGRNNSSVDLLPPDMMQENVNENGGSISSREADKMSERIVAMEEETKILKEGLAKRTEELQAARLMCAKTASRLSTVEEELELAFGAQGQTNQAGTLNLAKDSGKDLVLGKTSSHSSSHNRRESLNFELMDDFAEMERLAKSQSEPVESEHEMENVSFDGASEKLTTHTQKQTAALEEALALKQRDLQAANEMCRDLSVKLTAAEGQLGELRTRNAANEVSLVSLQEQLDRFTDTQVQESKGDDPAGSHSGRFSNDGDSVIRMEGSMKTRPVGSASEGSLSERAVLEYSTSVSNAESKASTVRSELAVAVCKIVCIVEALARATGREYALSSSGEMDSNAQRTGSDNGNTSMHSGQIVMCMHWKDVQLDTSIQSLVLSGNKFLQCKTDMVDFMFELGSTLDCIMAIGQFEPSNRAVKECSGDHSTSDDERTRIPMSVHLGDSLLVAESTKPGPSMLEEELQTLREERDALQSHVQAELGRFSDIETQLDGLKIQKAAVEHNLEEANERVKLLKKELKIVSQLRKRQCSNTSVTKTMNAGSTSSHCSAMAELSVHLGDSLLAESTKPGPSMLEEELRTLREERDALQSHVQAELGRFSGIETELDGLKIQKAAVEHNLEEANERVELLKKELQQAEKIVSQLRRRQDKQSNEDELIEEELLERSSTPRLASGIRAADAEMNQLHDKVAALEIELQGERHRHHDVVAKLEDLQLQIHRGAANTESTAGREADWATSGRPTQDDEESKSRKEREIAAAALAECQRTILALGKQLQVLRDPTDGALRPTIQTMTQDMELLRWQTEATDAVDKHQKKFPARDIPWSSRSSPAERSPSPGAWPRTQTGSRAGHAARDPSFYHNGNGNGYHSTSDSQDGPASSPGSPSDVSVSVQGSPATVLRSVRTPVSRNR